MSKNATRVSVVIPNYNHSSFLDLRITSVLQQSYQDFDILILDDASTDSSREVIATYAGRPRVKVMFNSVNSGSPFAQWNKGLASAVGDYVWIAEADDYADPSLLQTLLEKLEQHPTVCLAYCQSMLVDGANRVISSGAGWTDDLDRERWRHPYVNDGRDECRRYLSNRNTIPNASAVVFRRDTYLRAKPPNESYRLCGDWITWASLLLHGDIAFVPEPLNFFRRHGNSAFSRADRDLRFPLESYRVISFIKSSAGIPEPELERTSQQLMYVWMGSMLKVPLLRDGIGFFEVLRCALDVDERIWPRLLWGLLMVPVRAARSRATKIAPLRKIYCSIRRRIRSAARRNLR